MHRYTFTKNFPSRYESLVTPVIYNTLSQSSIVCGIYSTVLFPHWDTWFVENNYCGLRWKYTMAINVMKNIYSNSPSPNDLSKWVGGRSYCTSSSGPIRVKQLVFFLRSKIISGSIFYLNCFQHFNKMYHLLKYYEIKWKII